MTAHNYNNNTRIFFSYVPTCLEHSNLNMNVSISMREEPDIIYSENGKDVIIFSRIVIRKNHNSKLLSSMDVANASRFNIKQLLFLCIKLNDRNIYSKNEYLVTGPRQINNTELNKQQNFETLLNYKWYCKINNILVITFISKLDHQVNCEDNEFNQYSQNVTYSFYSFPGNFITIDKHLIIENSLVCWCGGNNCKSISDHSTTLLFPSFTGIETIVTKLTDEPIKLIYFGSKLSLFDELRIVDYNVKCGKINSSKMTNNLLSNSTLLENISLNYKPDKNNYGLVKKYSSNNDNYLWESFQLLVTRTNNNNLHYKICFCSFILNEQCKSDDDFIDTTGYIVNNETELKMKSMLIRIFISYSDTLNKTCSRNNINSFLPIVYSFRVEGDIKIASKFVSEFVTRYSGHEGFVYESCIVESGSDVFNSKNYTRFLIHNKSGIYIKQKLNIKAGIPQNIIIRGTNISKNYVYKLGIISVDLNCNESTSNIIQINKSAPVENNKGILFERLIIYHEGTYKLCINISENKENEQDKDKQAESDKESTSSPSKETNLEWLNAGYLRVKKYYINYTSDLIYFGPEGSESKPNLNQQKNETCSINGYKKMVQLCVLLEEQVIVLSDCNNRLWIVTFNVRNGIVNVSKDKVGLNVNFLGSETEKNWILCREVKSQKSLVFLGGKYVLVVDLPIQRTNLESKLVFPHLIVNPLDIAMININIFLISEGYKRGIYSYTVVGLGMTKSVKKRVAVANVYCNSILSQVETGVSADNSQLFCLDPEKNLINTYKLRISEPNPSLVFIRSYDGISENNSVPVGYLDKPSSMDFYKTSFMSETHILLVVSENTTGRIIVFKTVNEELSGYKVIYSRGLISRITVDSAIGMIYISSWRSNFGALEQFVQNKPISTYVNLNFYYNVLDKYQSGDEINLVPIKRGDYFEFFYEKQLPKSQKPHFNKVNLQLVGLSKDSKTGVITGKLNVTGRYSITIYGGNLLKHVSTTITIFASCAPGNQFNKKMKKCEECPIGTYRNDETEDICIPCSMRKTNSTTKQSGSRYFWECLCSSGYYFKGDKCVLCEPGTFKSEIGDAPCPGTCGNNVTSKVVGAKSLEELKCYCEPKFYNIKNTGSPEEIIPLDLLNSVGMGSKFGMKYKEIEDSSPICAPCDIGSYCQGGDSLPTLCGLGKSTIDRFSSSEDDCECDKGYGYNFNGCQPCSQFGYKDTVGNIPCTNCHTHSNRNDAKPLKLHSDLFRFNLEAALSKEDDLGIYQSFSNHLDKFQNDTSNTVLVTNELASKTVKACKFCISGYYFNINAKDCYKCPYNSYCPGFDIQPRRCGLNSILNQDKALSAIDCNCPMRYGNIYIYRNPINLSVDCRQCKVGFFQHLESTDISCLPCPDNTTTLSVGSKSILSCIPEKGYYIKGLLTVDHSLLVETDNQSEAESFESKYIKERTVSNKLRVKCIMTKKNSVNSRHSTIVLRETESSCSKECLRNIYCTGYSFGGTAYYLNKTSTPYTTNQVRLYDGTRFIDVEFKECKLYFFDLHIKSNDEEYETLKVCEVVYNFPFEAVLCPLDSFCTGSRIPTLCHENSVTLEIGSKSVDSCLCIAGYEPSKLDKNQCNPCSIGWYKEEVGNFSCLRCPDKFKTYKIGSKHASDCACTQGYYAVVENPQDLPVSGKYTVTGNSIYKSDKEVMIDLDLKIDDYNRLDFVSYHSYKLSLTDSLVLIPSGINGSGFENLHKIKCEKCLTDHYCPGGWFGYVDSDDKSENKLDEYKYKIHNIPYKCPFGSGIPPQSTNPSSLTHCLCLPGYMPEEENFQEQEINFKGLDQYFTSVMADIVKRTYSNRCIPCEPGMFKEGQENSPCSGRCMEYATTYGGSVSKSQCFCQYGRYMRVKKQNNKVGDENHSFNSSENPAGDYKNIKCSKCMEGATCPGGLNIEIVKILKKDYTFDSIKLSDHVKPKPKQGYFPAYPAYNNVEKKSKIWNPSEQNVSIVERVYTDFVEFHPCNLEFRCGSQFQGYCSRGSDGYLCSRCMRNYDIWHFRTDCSKCKSILREIWSYLSLKILIYSMVLILIVILYYDQIVCFVLIKIFMEFYFTMIPYGIISVFTNSSIKRFVPVFNSVFGYPLWSFAYFRLGCIFKSINYVSLWYFQRLTSVLIPVIDSIILFSICAAFLMLIERTYKITSSTSEMDTFGRDYMSEKKWRVLYFRILAICYFIQLHFIWIELLQLIWCVNLSYKRQNHISVLLYMPVELCSIKNFRFVLFATISGFILVLSFCCFCYYISNHKLDRVGEIFSFGYRRGFREWDSFVLLRRFIVSIICTIQIGIISPLESGRLRIISSLMLSCLIAVFNFTLYPFNLRSDNLFNRMQMLGISVNITTACIIQVLVCEIILFRAVSVTTLTLAVWRIVDFFTLWHTNAEITLNLKKKCITVEPPFEVLKGKFEKYRRNTASLSISSRNALSLSIRESLNRLILEKKRTFVPSWWLEFVVNYTMCRYDWYKRGATNYTSVEEMVITPWLISKFTIEPWQEDLVECIRNYDPERHDLLQEVIHKYKEKRTFVFDRIKTCGDFKEKKFNKMLEMTHTKRILEERLEKLNLKLEKLKENAKQGEKAVEYVRKIQRGVKQILDTKLTNEEILRRIEQYNKNLTNKN
ncbi:cysteine repeat modular protein [Theileria annulata]|uniref:Cysteine repeat modular protein homologue, putative n=1 Tax=Theileria annulata TaxID=5874 RepID=Q4UGZ8_THEAN|nr:cysteine repeat modular protein [Theileria annulata]CAI73641.1 cysteine repeat modular protein homologue, putative [Theileria annulata]|eukprot:XP_954318.1 cysteine repeat modular protein homologue, putative [Theileria annulata]